MTRSVQRLLDRYELAPAFGEARALPGQVGGVARAADPGVMTYRA
jgi:hypothetical protein